MAIVNFPPNPGIGDQYNENGITYTWNGAAWTANGAENTDARYVQVTGDTMTGNLNVPSINGGHAGPNNVIINGEMAVSQYDNLSARSVNNSVAACNRWFQRLNLVTAQMAISQDSDAPPGYSNSLQWACTTQAGALGLGEFAYIAQRIEGHNAQVFAKGTSNPKKFSVSFWVKSSKTGTYAFRLEDQKNNRLIGHNYTVDVANTWEYKSFTLDNESTNAELDNNNTSQLQLVWWLATGGDRTSGSVPTTWRAGSEGDAAAGTTVNLTDSTSNRFFITGVQLTASDTPIAFQHEDYETTLDKCRRYYQKYNFENVQFQRICMVAGTGGTNGVAMFQLTKPLRTNIEGAGFSSSPANSFRINGLADPSDRAISSISLSNNHGKSDYIIGLDIGFQNSRPAGAACYLSRENHSSPCFLAFESEL